MTEQMVSWRVRPRIHVLAVLWAAPVLVLLLLLSGFSWITFTCALLLTGIALVASALTLRITVADQALQLRYGVYLIEVDLTEITEVSRIDRALVGLGYKRAGQTTSFLLGGPYAQATTTSGAKLVFSVREEFAADLTALLDAETPHA